jgi:hypothetical protein
MRQCAVSVHRPKINVVGTLRVPLLMLPQLSTESADGTRSVPATFRAVNGYQCACLAALLGLGLLVLLAGCSRSTGRLSLEGTVTFDGAPLAEGSILFLPQGNTTSPTCGGRISQGRFSILPKDGAACGTFRVQITAVRNTGRKLTRPMDGQQMDKTEQFIPARYNQNSELTATVGDKDPNQFEFVLKSK